MNCPRCGTLVTGGQYHYCPDYQAGAGSATFTTCPFCYAVYAAGSPHLCSFRPQFYWPTQKGFTERFEELVREKMQLEQTLKSLQDFAEKEHPGLLAKWYEKGIT